ncbi:hypothetical protein ACP275_08G104800 [Erythranthe tilingii]
METPSSSTRRVTRSQTSAASANLQFSKEKGRERSGKKEGNQEERCALIDITNDSPIVGLAIGNLKTPSSSCSSYSTRKGKSINGVGTTPGSGEALLRGQVKTLLQKVEEEAEELVNNKTRRPPSFFINLIKSPNNNNNNHIVGAPTPANTPQLLFSVDDDDALSLPCLTSSPVQDNFLLLPPQKEEGIDECEKKKNNVITRSLLLDFSENEGGKGCSDDDDNESVWSIQVNASENQQEEEYYKYYEEEEEEDGFCGNLLSVLCEGMSNISVVDNEAPKFEVGGKHIRFIYDSDDEMINEADE